MENIVILEKKYTDKKINSISVEDEAITIFFVDGSQIKLSSYHDQSCCESVYADFSVMKYHKEHLVGKELDYLTLKRVPDIGFLVVFGIGYSPEKIFIACYNIQNGYYSSNLSVILQEGDVKTEVDISDCVEDNIY